MDACFARCTGRTAILRRFPGRPLLPSFAAITSYSQALALGPERGWSNWQGGFVVWNSTSLRPEYRMADITALQSVQVAVPRRTGKYLQKYLLEYLVVTGLVLWARLYTCQDDVSLALPCQDDLGFPVHYKPSKSMS